MRVLLVFLLILNFNLASVIDRPYKQLSVSANVLNTTLINGFLYIATDDGVVEIYDINVDKFNDKIVLKRVKNYFSNDNGAKVLSIDAIDDKILILSEDDYGSRLLYLKQNESLKPIKLANQAIKKALFLDDEHVILGSLSNEIYFFSLKDEKIYKSFKISTAAMSDMELNEDKNLLAIGAESGKIYIYNVSKDSFELTLDIHKDNIYDISYKNGSIISGGTDRIVGIYHENKLKKIDTGFLVYGVGLSDDGKLAAYMSDELSDVNVIDTATLNQKAMLKTGQSTINSIIFISKDEIITSAYERNLLFWRIK